MRALEKRKAANAGERAAFQTTHNRCNDTGLHKLVKANLGQRIWVLSYSIEEARQRYANRRQPLRQAGACLLLALLRLSGARYA